MKKLTSLFISGMLAVTGCVCAVSASAEDAETAKITVYDGTEVTGVYEVAVGEKFECTVKGTSAEKITAFLGSVYINQADATTKADESELDILGYSDAYFSNGAYYDPGTFSSMFVRPQNSAEFNLDKLGFIFSSGLPVAGFDQGVDMIKVAYEVKNPGECAIVTVVNDATYDDENGIPTKDANAIKTVTTLNVDQNTEDPTEEPTEKPTEAPTAEPTDAPTEKPTDAPTEKPTEAPTAEATAAPTNATTATDSTNATNATSATNVTSATSATSSSNTSNNNSSTTGKVATGDSTTIALAIASILLASAGTVVLSRKKFAR